MHMVTIGVILHSDFSGVNIPFHLVRKTAGALTPAFCQLLVVKYIMSYRSN